jgi:hypothetical protein
MATCSSIATRALKKLQAIAAGETPTSAELNDVQEALQGLLDGWCRDGTFGRLRDVHVTADYTAREFQRIRVDAGTVTLPDLIPTDQNSSDDYGFQPAQIDADELPDPNNRPPRNRSVIITLEPGGDWATWFYEADIGEWISIQALALADECPLSRVDADGLASQLALAVADQFGATPQPTTIAKAARFRSLLTNRADSTRRETPMQSF